jgi:hypothetical protein
MDYREMKGLELADRARIVWEDGPGVSLRSLPKAPTVS